MWSFLQSEFTISWRGDYIITAAIVHRRDREAVSALRWKAFLPDNGGMNDTRITVSRPLVGICALVCLVGAVGVWVFEPPPTRDANSAADAGESASTTQWPLIQAAFTRVGLVVGALWIALPTGRRNVEVSPKAFVIGLGAIVGVVVRPRFFLPLLIVLAVLAKILRPKDKNRQQAELARQYQADKD